MHTRAAESQSLHEHLLAYVKQNLPPAKLRAALVVLMLALILSASACARVTQLSPRTVQYQIVEPKPAEGPVININTASLQELEKLPGVGKGIAERIVAHREQYGPFRRPEHLMMVRGISDRKFRALRPMIVVD